MINKKFCITMSGFMIASLMLTGCSSMFGNPMKYVISQDETRQEQTESQNDTGNNDTSSDEHDFIKKKIMIIREYIYLVQIRCLIIQYRVC